MNLTQDYINQTVRRVVFSLKRQTGEYFHIFSILEKIEKDMLDYDSFVPNYGNEYNDFIKNADGSEDKIYLTVDWINISKDIFDRPWEHSYSGKVQFMPTTKDYRWPAGETEWRILPSDENAKTELAAVLPRRF